MKCFCCDGDMKMWDYSDDAIHPLNGLHFISYGHYGSSYFDPMDGSLINITICDVCLEKKSESSKITKRK